MMCGMVKGVETWKGHSKQLYILEIGLMFIVYEINLSTSSTLPFLFTNVRYKAI